MNSDTVKSALLGQGGGMDAGRACGLPGAGRSRGRPARAGTQRHPGQPVALRVHPENGARVARRHGARYRFAELVCEDLDELRRRPSQRVLKRSQMPDLDTPPRDASGPSQARRTGTHQWQSAKPDGPTLVLDVGPVVRFEDALAELAAYVRS